MLSRIGSPTWLSTFPLDAFRRAKLNESFLYRSPILDFRPDGDFQVSGTSGTHLNDGHNEQSLEITETFGRIGGKSTVRTSTMDPWMEEAWAIACSHRLAIRASD